VYKQRIRDPSLGTSEVGLQKFISRRGEYVLGSQTSLYSKNRARNRDRCEGLLPGALHNLYFYGTYVVAGRKRKEDRGVQWKT